MALRRTCGFYRTSVINLPLRPPRRTLIFASPRPQLTAGALAKSSIGPFVALINSTFAASQPNAQLDVSSAPNPFYGIQNNGTGLPFLDSDDMDLKLVDGGLDGAVTPYLPLLVPARKQDVIIAMDASADSPLSYPNGSSLVVTQLRSRLHGLNASYPFPRVPETSTTFGTSLSSSSSLRSSAC